jgi:hypothetical protein
MRITVSKHKAKGLFYDFAFPRSKTISLLVHMLPLFALSITITL